MRIGLIVAKRHHFIKRIQEKRSQNYKFYLIQIVIFLIHCLFFNAIYTGSLENNFEKKDRNRNQAFFSSF